MLNESQALRARFCSLRNKLRNSKNRPRQYDKIFNLNVSPGEFFGDVSSIKFDDKNDDDVEKRMLRTHVGDLEHDLAVMQQKLNASEDPSNYWQTDINSLTARIKFLENHMMALESEVQEFRQQTSDLKRKVGELENEQKAENREKADSHWTEQFLQTRIEF